MKIKFSHLYFTLGCVMLCNPVVTVFDILPDFIGCALIIKSLSQLKYLDYRIEQAVRELWLLAGISAVRTVMMPFYFDMDSSAVLATVSLLGAAEAFFFIYFALSFYRGMSYLASRSDGESVLDSVDNTRVITIVFILVRVACTVLPEIAAIFELEAQASLDYTNTLTVYAVNKYKRYAYLVAFAISTIAGVYWVKESASFVKNVRRDKGFFAAVTEKCVAFEERNPLVPLYETVRARGILYVVGSVFMMNLSVDGITVIPAYVGAAVFAFIALRTKEYKLAAIEAALAAGLALTEYLPMIKDVQWLSVLLFGLLTVAAVTAAGFVFRKVAATADVDVSEVHLLPQVMFALVVLATAAASFWFGTVVHTVRVVLFLVWLFTEIKLVYAVLDDIKARIRL